MDMDAWVKTCFIYWGLMILYSIISDIMLLIKHYPLRVTRVYPVEDRKTWLGRFAFYVIVLFSLIPVKWEDEE